MSGSRCVVIAVLVALVAAVHPPDARAQDAGTFEMGGGLRWSGRLAGDSVNATETAANNATYTLFKTDSQIEAAPGGEARVGFRIAPRLQVEGAFAFAWPELATDISADVEGAPDVTVSETITQLAFEGGVVARLAQLHAGTFAPFVSAGAGYLRRLHDDRVFVETGPLYYVGGGAYITLKESLVGAVKAAGIRADVRATFFSGGAALDEGTEMFPTVGLSFFVVF